MVTTMGIVTYLLVGFWIGFMIGVNSKEFPTEELNRKRTERENQELENKLIRYKKTIQDLVEDNRRLAKELERKDD